MTNNLPRVKIVASDNYVYYSDYLDEFIGKTGTVVWVADNPIFDYQCGVHLDIPHSIFGDFCRIVYFNSQGNNVRIQELFLETIDGSTTDDIVTMSKVIGNKWNSYHTNNGDLLYPETVLERYLKDLEKYNS